MLIILRPAALRCDLRSRLCAGIKSASKVLMAIKSCFPRYLLIAVLAAPTEVAAQTVEEFYKGRSLTMIVGGGVGGGYDVYARAMARHLPKHIPGHPGIVAKNVPAAGGLAAGNMLY